ncbi:MAG TPA: DMT family transporter [Chloroflexi bacterium]|nr:DMT family transporter [Chloroflexota bacterium]
MRGLRSLERQNNVGSPLLKVSRHQVSDDGRSSRLMGIYSGLFASFLLGWAPILGKFAYLFGVTPTSLAALRTVAAAGFLWGFYLIFWRALLRVSLKDFLNCFLVGAINGFGSLFYYSGLERLDASRASLLSALYPVWVVIFLSASGQRMTRLSLIRLSGCLLGAVLVTAPWATQNPPDYLGVMLMIASAAINGWYIVMGQWVLADVPARSATLYILTGMAITVGLARIATTDALEPLVGPAWLAIIALALTTAVSRLAMFLSLERLGGVQTAIISLTELAVSLGLAFLLLSERMSWEQWLGAVLLLGGGILARADMEKGAALPPSFNPMDV